MNDIVIAKTKMLPVFLKQSIYRSVFQRTNFKFTTLNSHKQETNAIMYKARQKTQ